LFQSSSASLGDQRFSQNKDSLLDTDTASLDHDEVVLDNTVVRETTQWSDGLFSQVSSGGSAILSCFSFESDTGSDSVDLLVDFSSVMVTILTSSGNAVSNSSWMPTSDTTDSSETSVGLSGQSLGSPSGGGTFESVSLGDTDNVDHFILIEDGADSNFLFEGGSGELDLLVNGSTVDLDFHDVSLLLSQVEEMHLGVSNNSDNSTVFLNSVELSINVLRILPLFNVFGECLFLGVHPVLVESSLEFLR